jgi:hypothetical protein
MKFGGGKSLVAGLVGGRPPGGERSRIWLDVVAQGREGRLNFMREGPSRGKFQTAYHNMARAIRSNSDDPIHVSRRHTVGAHAVPSEGIGAKHCAFIAVGRVGGACVVTATRSSLNVRCSTMKSDGESRSWRGR